MDMVGKIKVSSNFNMNRIAIVALLLGLMNCLETVDATLNDYSRNNLAVSDEIDTSSLIVDSPVRLQELVDFAMDSKIVEKLTDYTDGQEQWMRNIENVLKETEENKFNIMENPMTFLQYLSKQSYQSPRQMDGEETGSLISVNDFLEKFAGSLASDKDLQASAKGDYNIKPVVLWPYVS